LLGTSKNLRQIDMTGRISRRIADQARTDFAAIESDLEVTQKQLARLPTRRELTGTGARHYLRDYDGDDAESAVLSEVNSTRLPARGSAQGGKRTYILTAASPRRIAHGTVFRHGRRTAKGEDSFRTAGGFLGERREHFVGILPGFSECPIMPLSAARRSRNRHNI
jgi:hypothetical protein